MKIYLAPLEGVTNNFFRSSQYKYFGGIDKYFAPFITPSDKCKLGTKAKRDLAPENNIGQNLVPQILTNNADGFIAMCKKLEEYGYTEFNLNLGCPSGTVVSKGRGSGFLAHKYELDKFLENIYKSKYNISIKTRIGFAQPDEFYDLLDIFNQYPVSELIIHPRTRGDFYKNKPNWDIYKYAVENSKNKICYNGDIFTLDDYNKFIKTFPDTDCIMLGRGMISNPALAAIIKGEGELTKQNLKKMYDDIYENYLSILSGSTQLMHKMKEIALYIIDAFEEDTKINKKIKKAKNIEAFNSAVDELFTLCEIKK